MADRIEVKQGICHWCHNHCRVDLTIRNGRLEKMEGAAGDIRGEKLLRTVRACSRARAAAEWYYHPNRLTFPLKRVGEKGGGKWQQISWEQALDEIAAKLKMLSDRYGPETLATSSGTGRTDDEYRMRFINLFGTPNNVGQGHICYGPGVIVNMAVWGWPTMSAQGRRTKCILWSGANPEQSLRRRWFDTLECLKDGCKLIVIDPRRTKPAEKADIWLQLRPGTDTALYMAMINVIINEELYDREFVDKWCYGFDKLARRAQEYPPEEVAEISWVPAEKIRAAARMWATNRPGTSWFCMGVQHLPNSIEAIHCQDILVSLVGNLDVPGGDELEVINPGWRVGDEVDLESKISPEQRAKQIGAERFRFQSFPGWEFVRKYGKEYAHRAHTMFAHDPSVYDAMITGYPYPVRAMITLSSNPMVTAANTKHVYKALKSVDLYVVVDFWMTPSAELADYVLPSTIWLERPIVFNFWDLIGFLDCAGPAMPAQVEGQYDRRTDYEFWRGLGIRLGQEEYWQWKTLEEAYDWRLKPMGKTYKEVAAGGLVTSPRQEKKYEKTGFGTPTGKCELYSTVMEKLGYDPLPRFYEPFESPVRNPQLAKEYPLILITGGRHLPFYHSEHRQIDSLRKEHPYPLIQINPKTAAGIGISDGDWVWIETPRGRARQKCQYFDGIDPRVVHAQHGWWFPELPGEEPWLHGVWESNINIVTSDDPEHCNPMNGGWPLRTLLCKVYKAKVY